MSDQQRVIFTIGHSNHSLEAFVELLQQHGVTAIADVRSSPFSRFNPQFNKDALARNLKSLGIDYVFLGRELGARSDDPSCYEGGRVSYARLARTELFRAGLERVVRGSREHRIALMCAEKEPLECHRTLLVARVLADGGTLVEHILADGTVEQHEETLRRLVDLMGLFLEDLFRSEEEIVADALALQEARIAHVDERAAQETAGGER